MTSLGKHLAQLPLDLRLAKLLIMGTIFGCLGAVLTVASIMSCKPLFAAPFEKREEVSKARASFAAAGCRSDLLADAAAFEQWQTMRADRRSNGEIRDWCESNFISQSTLRDIQTNRLDLLSHLQEMGFVANSYSPFGVYDDEVYDRNAQHRGVLRSVIMAALWPAVVRIDLPSAKFDQSSSGTVQREAEARQVKYFDRNGRVFLHPSSTLFSCKGFESSYLTTFAKSSTGLRPIPRCTCAMLPRCRCSACCCSEASSRSTTLREGSQSARTRWRWRRAARRRTGFDCAPTLESAFFALSSDGCSTLFSITPSTIRKTCLLRQDAERCFR